MLILLVYKLNVVGVWCYMVLNHFILFYIILYYFISFLAAPQTTRL